jgi:hypothetical protein
MNKIQEKNMKKIFFCILKVTEEKSKSEIWSWIRIDQSEVRFRGSGSAPKCHGSPTMGNFLYTTIQLQPKTQGYSI